MWAHCLIQQALQSGKDEERWWIVFKETFSTKFVHWKYRQFSQILCRSSRVKRFAFALKLSSPSLIFCWKMIYIFSFEWRLNRLCTFLCVEWLIENCYKSFHTGRFSTFLPLFDAFAINSYIKCVQEILVAKNFLIEFTSRIIDFEWFSLNLKFFSPSQVGSGVSDLIQIVEGYCKKQLKHLATKNLIKEEEINANNIGIPFLIFPQCKCNITSTYPFSVSLKFLQSISHRSLLYTPSSPNTSNFIYTSPFLFNLSTSYGILSLLWNSKPLMDAY